MTRKMYGGRVTLRVDNNGLPRVFFDEEDISNEVTEFLFRWERGGPTVSITLLSGAFGKPVPPSAGLQLQPAPREQTCERGTAACPDGSDDCWVSEHGDAGA